VELKEQQYNLSSSVKGANYCQDRANLEIYRRQCHFLAALANKNKSKFHSMADRLCWYSPCPLACSISVHPPGAVFRVFCDSVQAFPLPEMFYLSFMGAYHHIQN
jgi:hypothetical protein